MKLPPFVLSEKLYNIIQLIDKLISSLLCVLKSMPLKTKTTWWCFVLVCDYEIIFLIHLKVILDCYHLAFFNVTLNTLTYTNTNINTNVLCDFNLLNYVIKISFLLVRPWFVARVDNIYSLQDETNLKNNWLFYLLKQKSSSYQTLSALK